MRVFYCDCGQKMRVPEERLGRRGHCPACGRIVAVTWDNTLPTNKARPAKIERQTPKSSPAHPELATPEPHPQPLITPMAEHPLQQESDPLSEDASTPGAEDLSAPRPPMDPAPITPLPPPDAPAIFLPHPELRENSLELLLNAMAAAMDFRKWLFAFGISLICITGGGALLFTAYIHWMLSIGLGILWGALCWGLGLGYIARLIHVQLHEKRFISFSHSERFLSRRFFDLLLALAVPAIPLVIIALFLNGILFLMSQTPGSGAALRGIALAPAFIINGALLLMAITSTLVPCIIAVDDVDLKTALNRLSRLILNRPGPLFAALGCATGLALLLLAGLGGIAALAIYATLKVSHILPGGTETLLNSTARLQNGWDAQTALICCAIGIVLTAMASIIITLFTACLTFTCRWTAR